MNPDERDVLRYAQHEQRRDANANGTIINGALFPAWGDVDLIVQDEYLADARFHLRTAMVLGYTKTNEETKA